MDTLLLVLVGLVYLGCRHRVRLTRWLERLVPSRRAAALRPLGFAPHRPIFGTVTISEVAFDYQRAVLELTDISDATKDRALHLVQRMIVPLIGHVRLDDVTPELEKGTLAVLVVQVPGDERTIGLVWRDLLRWGRVNCARQGLAPRGDGESRLFDAD